jgi:hypothetical protein
MSLEHEHDKKFGGEDDGFTAAVEPGHQIQYDEQPEVHSGLKRQLKSRHVSSSHSSRGLLLIHRWP